MRPERLLRHQYESEDARKATVARLTTRIPFQLRAQLKMITAWPAFGYATQTHMYTKCLIEFLEKKPWERGELNWRQSTRSDAETPVFHAHLEPYCNSNGVEVSGTELKKQAIEIAEQAGVNQAMFALGFLWWIALTKHPIPGAMEQLKDTPGAWT